jgi:WD40 repeat protein
MMTMALFCALMLGAPTPATQTAPTTPPATAQAPPDTEVYLARLTIEGDRITVGAPTNISNSPGYDNQPSFSSDGASVYFTSARGEKQAGAAAAQMDIYRYVLASQRTEAVTRTPESEYSATVTPDGARISVIRVEADGTQRLWSFTTGGNDPKLVLTDIKPVGYHAWLDTSTLALFVLGQPATLQIADVRSGTAQPAARDIGRSLQRMPGGGVSYVQRAGDAGARTMTISSVKLENGKPVTAPITPVAPGASDEYVVWTPDGSLLMAAGGKLYSWRSGRDWTAIADLASLNLTGVSRLAISPKGDWLALVAQSSAAR